MNHCCCSNSTNCCCGAIVVAVAAFVVVVVAVEFGRWTRSDGIVARCVLDGNVVVGVEVCSL